MSSPDKPSMETENHCPAWSTCDCGACGWSILLLVVGILIGIAGAFSDFVILCIFAGVVLILCWVGLLWTGRVFSSGWIYWKKNDQNQSGTIGG